MERREWQIPAVRLGFASPFLYWISMSPFTCRRHGDTPAGSSGAGADHGEEGEQLTELAAIIRRRIGEALGILSSAWTGSQAQPGEEADIQECREHRYETALLAVRALLERLLLAAVCSGLL